MRIVFGSGYLFALPQGISGGGAFTGSPIQFATLQDVDVSIDATIKELRGNLQFPDDTAISDKKITWKSGSGRFSIDIWNNIFFGEPAITAGSGGTNPGGGVPVVNEAQQANGSTITVTNAANFTQDMGVIYSSSGQPLQKVNSAPTVGQYVVNVTSGIYTLSAADNTSSLLISYRYKITSGRLLKVGNHVQGYGPYFELLCAQPYQELTTGIPNYLDLYSCKAGKLGAPLKRADYLISDIEGQAYSNAAGYVGEFYED